jgi:hypothetical protein
MDSTPDGTRVLDAWAFVRRTLDDLTDVVVADAETELELAEGLRVLARITALASEVSLDTDPEAPWFFSMNSPVRLIGGPNPDGEYLLAMIDGRHGYRVRGRRGTSAYLGFQVLAGTGLTPRRMAAYVADRDLTLDADGGFSFVLAPERPAADVLAGDRWIEIPADASAIVVREYIADRSTEVLADLAVEPLAPAGPPGPATGTAAVVAEGLTALAWTALKLMTLHRTIKPELLDAPNTLVTAEAADLGAADTTPDNLYALGSFRLGPDEALVIELEPPQTRYWSVTLENVWHECLEPRRRASSITNAGAVTDPDGVVRIVVAATDPRPGADPLGDAGTLGDADTGATGNWLDTGGRHRGWIVVRWLDNPTAPPLTTRVVSSAGLAR